MMSASSQPFRKTTQKLAPIEHSPMPAGTYDIYPAYPIGTRKIGVGYRSLAEQIAGLRSPTITIDGYIGIMWEDLVADLDAEFRQLGLHPHWVCIDVALKSAEEIETLITPYIGGSDPLFGSRSPLMARDFLQSSRLAQIHSDPSAGLSIVYGTGSTLAGWNGPVVYCDVPKNEIQFRSRAGSVRNFGAQTAIDAKQTYKRMYFVDWPVLNRHRKAVLDRIDLMVDTQRPDSPTFMSGNDFRSALNRMANTVFRVRPWFEPGPWGGQWIKEHVPQIPREAPNYAWSFELIAPENGIAFESDGKLLEVSFDFLMLNNHRDVLGHFADRFGYEFPIRYDFLDTIEGGNLSLQCHPRPEYIHRNFGETFTQDETYYILDCKPGAEVYLGFQQNVKPPEFRAALEQSFKTGSRVAVASFVNTESAHRHDLFLIPNGTIHCSGVNNLVLEISATPYIFTFKMYDWLRMDLNGEPRPLNIERAFENLYFERRGQRVKDELVSKPRLLRVGPDWLLQHLPTHRNQFYDVHRYEFATAIEVPTGGSCQVMSLVEGESVTVETPSGFRQRFSYAETFVVPAATERFRLINHGARSARVITTFLKPDARPLAVPEGAR
jgi:mannose-6-phosphate isomerase class I